jgi:hypothetical protein
VSEPGRGGVSGSEHLAVRALREAAYRRCAATSWKADYLDQTKRMRGSLRQTTIEVADTSVRFGSSKEDAKMSQPARNLGHTLPHRVVLRGFKAVHRPGAVL